MNWERGLARAWIFFTVIWVAIWLVLMVVHWPQETDAAQNHLTEIAITAVWPPTALLILGWGLLWVVRGFRKP